MKPLRKYSKATIYFRDFTEPDGEYYDVCLYSSLVVFFDKNGNERTAPMVFVKQIIEYVEDRVKPKQQLDPEKPVQPPKSTSFVRV